MRRIGLLGGTFDPPHLGHLWLGETAVSELHLDEIWVLPVGDPPHKESRSVTAVSHRLNMTQLALEPFPYFQLSTLDSQRKPPHTTISLLNLLHEESNDYQFWLLIGADSLRDFPSWSQPNEIIKLCRLGVLERPEVIINWDFLETAVPHLKSKVDWLNGPTVDISSTTIRSWIKAGHSVQALVGTAVWHYILEHKLYTRSGIGDWGSESV